MEFTASQGEQDVHECSGMFSVGDVQYSWKGAERAGSETGAGCLADLSLRHGALEHEASSAEVGSPATWFSLNYLCDFYQV